MMHLLAKSYNFKVLALFCGCKVLSVSDTMTECSFFNAKAYFLSYSTHQAERAISCLSNVCNSVDVVVSPFSSVTSVVHSIFVIEMPTLQRIGFTYWGFSSLSAVAAASNSMGGPVGGKIEI